MNVTPPNGTGKQHLHQKIEHIFNVPNSDGFVIVVQQVAGVPGAINVEFFGDSRYLGLVPQVLRDFADKLEQGSHGR